MSGPLFGIVPAGQQLITEPTSAPSPTSFLYTLPTVKVISHIMVFLLPDISLPEGTAAAIYIGTVRDVATTAQSGGTPTFRFLGGIGGGKSSALFKVGPNAVENDGDGMVLGISIESTESVGQHLQELSQRNANTSASSSHLPQLPTAVLAQRIIQNAFNFLASFSGSSGPGEVEVVPLKAFEEWWRRFEARVRADPGFLDRQDG